MTGGASLEGRVAVVTGAAGGIGAAIARRFMDAGCRVVAADIDSAALMPEAGRHHPVALDVTQAEGWESLRDDVLRRFGRIDALVSNAAHFEPLPLLATGAGDLDAHYQVNQRGFLLGLRAVIPAMVERGRGSVVAVASTAGMAGASGAFAYAATKWAVRGMARSAAIELAGSGVRVNTILPGLVDTRMMARNPPERNEGILAAIPMHRAGRADEIADAALFLASEASSYMTGSELVVDGGLMA